MDLYFAPLACSLATRIAIYEAGAQAGLKGSAGTKVESSAIVEVKGAMINLN